MHLKFYFYFEELSSYTFVDTDIILFYKAVNCSEDLAQGTNEIFPIINFL